MTFLAADATGYVLMKPPPRTSFFTVLLSLTLCLLCSVPGASAAEKVTLQLKWIHQFQFAGYYAAVAQGYYRDAGLDVTILPATPGEDPTSSVIDGKAQYGVGTSSLLLLRNAGKPVVTLAVILQHSPYLLLTGEISGNQTIHSLVGKRLMLEHQADEVVAYLKNEGLPLEKMRMLPHSFNIHDLIDGKVDVISGYATDDPDILDRAGFHYHAYSPRSAGIDFYGDNLFTTEKELKDHPARARAFREASLKGWHYALDHSDEIIDLIIARYSPKADRDHLKYEARQIRQLMQPDLIEIGYSNPGRWRHIAEIYADLGMLPKNVNLQNFIFDPNPDHGRALIYRTASALLALVLIVIVGRLVLTSRRLKRSEARIREQLAEISLINSSLEDQVTKRTAEIESANVLLQLFMKYSPVYTFIQESSAEDSRVLLSSENYQQLLGIPGSEMVGKSISEMFPPELATKIISDNWEVIRSGKVSKLVESFNGNVYYSIKFPIEQGGKTLLAGYTIDITEQKQLEMELQRKNSQLAMATHLAKIVPWELDVTRLEFIFNDQFYTLYDTTAEQEGGYTMPAETFIREFSHPDDAHLIQQHIEQVFAPGSSITQVEIDHRVISRAGIIHNAVTRVNVERDGQNKVMGVYGYNQDITVRKQMELDLQKALTAAEAANRAKSLFLSNMSHEIRTPLNAVIGYSALMLNHPHPPLQRDYLGKIHTSGKLLLNIVNDILDFSKIESGNLTLEQTTFKTAVVIDNVLGMVQQNSREKGLSVRADSGAAIASCLVGDPHRLAQILANLLSNAVKFTLQGEIVLTAQLLQQQGERQQLQFSIRDTGIGLSPEQRGKLFLPFTQADDSTTRNFGGTGLGLSISKQLVELMGGTIWCESTEGVGSTFSFTAWFGIGKAGNVDPFTVDGTLFTVDICSSYDFTGRRVLLVEDNQTNQMLAIELLKETGIEIEVAGNGQEAVTKICGSPLPFDLVLMDIQMPIMDGFEATRQIRQDGRFGTLPIIAMTAHAMEEEQHRILQAGMDVHISKPIDIANLLRVMDLFLNRQTPTTSPVGSNQEHQEPAATMHATTPTVSSDSQNMPYSDIPGLNVTEALLRLSGKVKLYDKLLRSFVTNWGGITPAIEEALQRGERELASRHAHSIKGSAGTIGAGELELRAQALETAINDDVPAEIISSIQLHTFSVELDRLVEEIQEKVLCHPCEPKA